MTAQHTHMNTADRLRTGDTITFDSKPALIVDITITHDGRLALLTLNPHGGTFGYHGAKLLLVGGGACINFTPGNKEFGIAGFRPGPQLQPTQIRRRGAHYEVYDNLDGDWAYIVGAPYKEDRGGPIEATSGNLYGLAAQCVAQAAA